MHKIPRKIKYFVSYRLKILNSLKLYTDGLFGCISNKWMTVPKRSKPGDLVEQNKVGWRNKRWKKSWRKNFVMNSYGARW